jgi:predicted nuclease of restriction endonuclease-like (RecB) superfamily
LREVRKARHKRTSIIRAEEPTLLNDVRQLIVEARARVASAVNTTLTRLNWLVGKRVGQEILKGERAEYGEEILVTLSQELSAEFGDGYSYSALTRMVKFANEFPDESVISTLSETLTWSHFCVLLPLKDALKREFYAELCRVERWNVRTLRAKIGGMLYERTALSRKPVQLARLELAALRDEDRLSTDLVLKDPYLLDFLGLKNAYLERDLEAAILREMEQFILELGSGFAFLARQKRFTLDGEDFHIDLLFYQRDLRRLVAVELKLDRFRAEHKGQMELYLRWLDKHERKAGEEAPIGIILCSGKDHGRIELLELGKRGIHVAEYLTALPPKEVLQKKLQQAVTLSRARMERKAE